MSETLLFTVLTLAMSLATSALAADGDSLMDPTRPLNFIQRAAGSDFVDGGMASADNLRLSSVLIRAEDRIAIVNDRRVRVGDTIGRARIMGIDKDAVTLDVDGEHRVLQLYRTSVRTPATGETNE